MDTKRYEIYLGALLHDIGKFYQRADSNYLENSVEVQRAKKIAEYICPKNQNGYFGYQHVIWTYQFYLNNESIFKKVIPHENIFDAEKNTEDNFVNFAIYHHKPNTELQAIIQLADWWASGLDRSSSTEYANKDINWGKDRYKTIPLSSIFQNLIINNTETGKQNEWHFDLNPLSFTRNVCFPTTEFKNNDFQADYKTLWAEFQKEFQLLPTGSQKNFLDSLHFLLKKYLWCIPASTMDYPDSSLFEHTKMTAAFADCLYSYYEKNKNSFTYDAQKHRIKLSEGNLPVLLLCVDISGIQKFIYDISSKYAAKSLRGRSFYLQILIETIANQLIEITKTTQSHVIYSSGGKMFMLLPNLEEIKTQIENYRKNLEKQIWEAFNGSLFVCMDYVAFAYDFQEKDSASNNIVVNKKDIKETVGRFYKCKGENCYVQLGDLWKATVDKTASRKSRKFDSIITKLNLFEPLGNGGESKICAVTGLEDEYLVKVKDEDGDSENDILISRMVNEQIEIGKALVKHNFLIYSGNQQPKPVNDESFHFTILNSNWYIVENIDEISSVDNAKIYKTIKNDFDFLNQKKGEKSIYSYRFYGGIDTPLIAASEERKGRIKLFERPKTFDELAETGGNFERLAVLRMDVDSLSTLFVNGFRVKYKPNEPNPKKEIYKQDNSNFSKLATLSFQLDLFFSGYINTIREKPEYKDKVSIIYSGGDDVFAVGAWDAVFAFAAEIRNEFNDYVCKRQEISISAGIALVGKKFPIAKSAELSGKAEKSAKGFVNENGKAKNAINIFGENVSWDKEFEFVREIKSAFVYWHDGGISSGLLQRFIVFSLIKNRHKKEQSKNKNADLSYRWHSAYSIARYIKKDMPENLRKFLEKLKEGLFSQNYNNQKFENDRFYDICAIAARWAELEIRTNKN